jgi:hypothetical protein
MALQPLCEYVRFRVCFYVSICGRRLKLHRQSAREDDIPVDHTVASVD